MSKWISNAQWPLNVYRGIDGTGISTDEHDSEEGARHVCKALEREGFGGEGKAFPIRTWVTEKKIMKTENSTDVSSDACEYTAIDAASRLMRDAAFIIDRHTTNYKKLQADLKTCAELLDEQQKAETVARSMESAPRDGRMLQLLVQFDEHATEDTLGPAWTIGGNSFDENGKDNWQFAGWCWDHDHFTEGKGTPVGWAPMIDDKTTPSTDRVAAQGGDELVEDVVAKAIADAQGHGMREKSEPLAHAAIAAYRRFTSTESLRAMPTERVAAQGIDDCACGMPAGAICKMPTCHQLAEALRTTPADTPMQRVIALRDQWKIDAREYLFRVGVHMPASVDYLVEQLDAAIAGTKGNTNG